MPWKQGIFTPKHPEKYKGSTPIIYRSEPELRIFSFADNNPRIIQWSSESVIVPYIKPTDGKVHRYYVDFTMSIKDASGKIVNYLVEYKPYKQSIPPKPSKNKKPSTVMQEQLSWAVNSSKWQSARAYAEKNGWKFMVITERDLG